jgi:hypothetical protein
MLFIVTRDVEEVVNSRDCNNPAFKPKESVFLFEKLPAINRSSQYK